MTVIDVTPNSVPAVDAVIPAPRVTHHPGGGAVVWLSGEHDPATKYQLCDVLAFEFSAHDGDLIVDLSDVTFMDCSTIGVLVGGKRWMAEQNRWMSVRDPSPRAAVAADIVAGTLPLDGIVSRPSKSR